MRFRRTDIPLIIILCCLASCSRHPVPKGEETSIGHPIQNQERYFEFVYSTYGNGWAKTVANLGKPRRVWTEKEYHQSDKGTFRRYQADIDYDVVHLEYEGLSLEILKANGPPYEEYCRDIVISSDKYKMLWNLGVGSPREEVRRIFGDRYPFGSDARKDIFIVIPENALGDPLGYEYKITIAYHADLISQIRLQFYFEYVD